MTVLNSRPERNLQSLTDRLGYSFSDPDLFSLALRHRSIGRVNNERLEYLGDAVLGFVIAECLYRQFPTAGEGALSRLRALLVKGESLAQLAREIGLGDYLTLGHGEKRSGGSRRDSILAGAIEGLIGAVHLDGGVEESRALILKLFQTRLADLTMEQAVKDAKTRLQERLQACGAGLPEYQLASSVGSPPSQSFVVLCRIPGQDAPVKGEGRSRRRAEQEAAGRALRILDGQS